MDVFNKRSLKSLIAISSSLLFVIGFQSPAHSATKMIGVVWRGTEMTMNYEPDSRFVVGKKPSSSLLKSEATRYCGRTFGWMRLEVYGASGKLMGSSGNSSSLVLNQVSVISGKWQVNEDGEDEYSLTFNCHGSLASPVTAKSKAYSLTFLHRDKFYAHPYFSSPYFSVADLNSANWMVDAEFEVDDQFNCCGVDNQIVWNPLGSQYP